MNMRLTSKIWTIGMLSVLIAVAVLLCLAPSASAEGSGPTTVIPGLGRPSNDTLIRMHNSEAGWLRDMESTFTEAGKLSSTFQGMIDALAGDNKDVTSLKSALVTFDSEVIASRAIHTRAGADILNLVGWKANGDVRDRLAAGISLLDGRAGLKDVNFRLSFAIEVLNKAFVKWRAARING